MDVMLYTHESNEVSKGVPSFSTTAVGVFPTSMDSNSERRYGVIFSLLTIRALMRVDHDLVFGGTLTGLVRSSEEQPAAMIIDKSKYRSMARCLSGNLLTKFHYNVSPLLV